MDPKTVSQIKLKRGRGKRVTLHVCVLSRDDPAQNMFSVILTGNSLTGDSLQSSLGNQKTVWFNCISGSVSMHMSMCTYTCTHRERGRERERERERGGFVFL